MEMTSQMKNSLNPFIESTIKLHSSQHCDRISKEARKALSLSHEWAMNSPPALEVCCSLFASFLVRIS
jgi:hypothetical protein